MKIAILSDIHGNIFALKAVEKHMQKENIDEVWILGDQLGYYYQANKVYELVLNWKHKIISGNHERIFLNFLKGDDIYRKKITKKYGGSFEYYRANFSELLIKTIENLPNYLQLELEGVNYLLCHGSPRNPDQYVYPNETPHNLNKLIENQSNFIFCGHTHYPMFYVENNVRFINVGSVGQSRVCGGIANWGILNTENGVYTPQSTPYDTKALIHSLKSFRETHKYLYEILNRNND